MATEMLPRPNEKHLWPKKQFECLALMLPNPDALKKKPSETHHEDQTPAADDPPAVKHVTVVALQTFNKYNCI